MRFSFKVLSHLKKRSFDVVHCHNLQLLPLAILLKKLKKAPLIFDSCEPDYYSLYPRKLQGMAKFLEKMMARRAEAILVHNDYQSKYRALGHELVTLVGVIHQGNDLGNSSKDLPQEKVRLGQIGSIYQDNGIEEILEGFKLLSPSTETLNFFLPAVSLNLTRKPLTV
jgi:hypothetical protein